MENTSSMATDETKPRQRKPKLIKRNTRLSIEQCAIRYIDSVIEHKKAREQWKRILVEQTEDGRYRPCEHIDPSLHQGKMFNGLETCFTRFGVADMDSWCETCRIRKPYRDLCIFWGQKRSAHLRALNARVLTDAPKKLAKFRVKHPPEVE